MSEEILKQLAALNEQYKKLERSTAELHEKLSVKHSLHGPVSDIAEAAKKAGEVAAAAASRKGPSEWSKLFFAVAATVGSAWIIAQCGIKPAGEAASKAVEKVGEDVSRSNSEVAASNEKAAESIAAALRGAQKINYDDVAEDRPDPVPLLEQLEGPKPKIKQR